MGAIAGVNLRDVKQAAYWVGILLLVFWLVRIVDSVVPADLTNFGLMPRTASGLVGIVTMPLLHADYAQLTANSISIAILCSLLILVQRSNAWWILAGIWLGSGAAIWCVGDASTHVGATALGAGMIGYLILHGFLNSRPLTIIVAILVAVFFGSTITSGMFQKVEGPDHWRTYASGFVVGLMMAYLAHRVSPKKSDSSAGTKQANSAQTDSAQENRAQENRA